VVGRNDPVALADAMLQLANDPALRARMGQRGRAFVNSDMFSWDRIADQLREIYDELMAGSPAGAPVG
jgi:glycosyltransferase involved in cell wall biosynthesis